MRATLVTISIVVVLAVVSIRSFTIHLHASRPTLIIADPHALDLGEVWLSDQYTIAVPMKNVTDEPVEVTSFRSSCNCVQVSPAEVTLLPGETVTVSVTLDLRVGAPMESRGHTRLFDANITPVTRNSASGQYQSWEVKGCVKSPFITSGAEPLEFIKGQPEPRAIEIESLATLSSVDVCARTDIAAVSANLNHDGRRCQIQITPRLAVPSGEHVFAALVSGETEDGQSFEEIPVTFLLRIRDDVICTPSTVVWGFQPVGTDLTSELKLESLSGEPFAVHVQSPGDKVAVDPMSATNGTSGFHSAHAFRVSHRVTTQGMTRALIRFRSIMKGREPQQIEVPLVVYGRQ